MQNDFAAPDKARPRRSPLSSIIGLIEGVVTRPVRLIESQEVAPRFRHLILGSESSKSIHWMPGQKVDVQIGSLAYRAYTPIHWDSASGRIELLVFAHGMGPGAQRLESLRLEEQIRIFGPGHSTDLSTVAGCLSLFGDETSLALMAARRAFDPTFTGEMCFLETDTPECLQRALEHFGLWSTTVLQKRAASAHLDAVAATFSQLLLKEPHRKVLLTGRAASIQKVRKALVPEVSTKPRVETHAFWAEGKVALG